MFNLIQQFRDIALFYQRYELYKILEKVAKASLRNNHEILIPAKYDIPSLIWPPPNEKSSVITTYETTKVKVVS